MMNDDWKSKAVKVQDILDVCEKAADACRGNAEQIVDSAVKGKVDTTLLDAYAWFIQEERKYRYDIPSVIREAVEAESEVEE
jgi:hypothetical protein